MTGLDDHYHDSLTADQYMLLSGNRTTHVDSITLKLMHVIRQVYGRWTDGLGGELPTRGDFIDQYLFSESAVVSTTSRLLHIIQEELAGYEKSLQDTLTSNSTGV